MDGCLEQMLQSKYAIDIIIMKLFASLLNPMFLSISCTFESTDFHNLNHLTTDKHLAITATITTTHNNKINNNITIVIIILLIIRAKTVTFHALREFVLIAAAVETIGLHQLSVSWVGPRST